MNAKKAFAVSPREMFEKMILEFGDFKLNTDSTRHAINFVLTAHHLKEWVWKSYLKGNKTLREKISPLIQDKNSYHSFLNSNCEEIKLVRELANSIKHFYATEDGKIQETNSGQKTWEEIDCTLENWQVPWGYNGLILITRENHWISALDVFQKVHDYWVGHFNTFFSEY